MEGFEVMPALEAAARGDVFITVTGARDVLGARALRAHEGRRRARQRRPLRRRDRPRRLRALADGGVRQVRPLVEQYDLGDRRLNLLASRPRRQPRRRRGPPGRGHGHLLRAPGARRSSTSCADGDAAPGVHPVPADIDREVARLKLASLGVQIDALTAEQRRYRRSWE